jgi:hypothetical protein
MALQPGSHVVALRMDDRIVPTFLSARFVNGEFPARAGEFVPLPKGRISSKLEPLGQGRDLRYHIATNMVLRES